MSGNASVAVARVSKSFGSEGELLVSLFDTFPDDFDLREPLFVEIDRLAVPLFCDRFERRGRNGALVVFADFYSERRTAELIGRELFLCGGRLADGEKPPGDGLVYLEDLVGLEASVGDAESSKSSSTARIRCSCSGSTTGKSMCRPSTSLSWRPIWKTE